MDFPPDVRQSTYGIDFLNLRIVGHAHVDELGHKLLRSRLAHKQPYLFERIGNPREEDQERDANSTDRIQVPNKSVTNNGHDQTEYVDNDIIAVVDLSQVSNNILIIHHQGPTYEEDMN